MKKQVQEMLAARIASALHRVHMAWAGWLNKHINRMYPPLRMALLGSIGLIAMLWCARVMAAALFGNQADHGITAPSAVTVPHVPVPKGRAPPMGRPSALLAHIDSLSTHDPERWDSIVRHRPGLIDTIRFIRERTDQK